MDQNDDTEQQIELEEETYTPDQDRSVSDAVLEAIEQHKDEDATQSDFVLYEDINLDALDNLFRHDAKPRTVVAFDTDDVRVEIYGDSGVKIRVRERPG